MQCPLEHISNSSENAHKDRSVTIITSGSASLPLLSLQSYAGYLISMKIYNWILWTGGEENLEAVW